MRRYQNQRPSTAIQDKTSRKTRFTYDPDELDVYNLGPL